ncbi:MAG: Ig-like domain-containing protein [Clostridia bacterium]|nr:Ig-like domain-containing protein [Clostridia bacterium]
MSKIGNTTKKALAVVLTMLLVFGMVPVSAIPVSAATTDYPEAVTVTVKDGNGNTVSGAEVSFTITDDANVEIEKGTVTTNANGAAEVLAKADYKDGLTINATVTKDGYTPAVISKTIASSDENIEAVITANEITGITVVRLSAQCKPDNATGKAQEFDAVSVQGTMDGDKVYYQINGSEATTEVPRISKPGKYNVMVTVKRAGYVDFVAEVVSEITDIRFTAKKTTGVFTGEPQELLKETNFTGLTRYYGYSFDFYIGEEKTTSIPQKTDVGEYTVRVVGKSSFDGLSEIDATFKTTITPAQLNAGVVTVTPYSAAYDGSSHAAVDVKPADGKALKKVEYSVDGGTTWTQTVPVIKDVDTYAVKVRVELDDKNYESTEYDVTAMITAGDREFKFNNDSFNVVASSKSNAEIVTMVDGVITINKVYSFGATAQEQDKSESVVYKVSVLGDDGKATIDEKGRLVVTEPGTFKITAKIAATQNYVEKEISHELNVRAVPKDTNGDRVAFVDFGATDEITYYVNKNSNVIADIAADTTVKSSDASNVTYKIFAAESDKPFGGIACDAESGKVYISNIDSFIAYLNRANGLLKIKVVATKSEGKIAINDSDYYIINIQYPLAPAKLFTLNMSLTATGWTNSEVIVNPVAGYTIAKAQKYGQDTTVISHEKIEVADDAAQIKTALDNAFTSNVKFGDDGQNHRAVYLCDEEGYIYAPVDVKININGTMQDLKIDRHNPDASSMKISYSDEKASIGDVIKTLFYKDTVTVTLEATDELSGIQRFTCEYNGKEIPVENFESADGKSATATATITIAEGEEYKNKVSFKAYDRAGNATQKTGDETVIIDYVSPEMSVEYVNTVNLVSDDEAKTYYFNETAPLVYKVKVIETNGFEENGVIRVLKDGEEFEDAQIEYTREGTEDVFTVTVPSTTDNEGVYTVEASYKDKSTNVMKVGDTEVDVFVSDEMVIDVTDAEVVFDYKENSKHNNAESLCKDYLVKLTVTEVNFDPATFVATVDAEDIKGNDILVPELNAFIKNPENWKSVGENKYECVLTYDVEGVLPDAVYNNIEFVYTDLADNDVTVNSEAFVIDTTAPTAPKIGYETPVVEVLAKVATLGLAEDEVKELLYKFFKYPAKITISSSDITSGMEKFVLEYNREDGASKENKEQIIVDNIKPVQDKNSKHIFEATVVLPKGMTMAEFDQLRGSLTAYAVDKHGIKSETVTDDGTVIVVDNIAPEVSVSYNDAARDVENKHYYNDSVIGTITVTEANFYEEDVKLAVTKDTVEIETPVITWTQAKDKDGKVIPDTYKGVFELSALEDHSADGDYVVNVTYTDKSTNEAIPYESEILVIDTTAPVINVVYSNTTPQNTLEDINGITRDYFKDEQVATITITEHNFVEEEVELYILEQDVSGEPVAQTREESAWTTDGDVHTMTITYPGSANYTFDIAYTDLATNEAEDYTPDYFTVDKTDPELTVEQINNVATTFINNISFGYFGGAKDKNAKAEVKVTVKDNISFANVVTATYNQTDGTSSVNKKTETQTANADKISLSKDGKTATTTFWLPVTALKTDKNNMHGDVKFIALDRAGNSSDDNENSKDVTGVIVDNISPKAKIEFSKPYTTANNISYYNGKIAGKITVVEANFDNPEDFKLYYSKDGGKKTRIPLKWTDESVNVHTATFTLSQDGDYILTAVYADKATNKMADYKSHQLTIDTKINAPVITFQGNSNGGLGFNDEVIPGVKFEDDNYKSYQITLTRTRYDEKNIDVKDKFIGNRVAINANGGSGSFNTFEKIRDNDGVYTLTVRMTDMVDHSSTTSRTFVVNRFGSVYVYNDALIDLINKRYVQDVNDELVITEYNANKLKDGSLKVDISRDGRPVDDVISSTAPVKNNGWYEYAHTINRENFNAEGLYKIAVSSTDEINNDSQNKEEKNTFKKDFTALKDVLWFKVDKTLPSITNISFKDEAKNKDNKYTEINAEGTEIEFNVYDAIGIAKVEVIVDGESTTYEGETLGDDINNFVGKITLAESKKQQEIVIRVTDLAGRVLDTSKKEESKESIPDSFTGSILVSTNFFVRFWNDQPVFWGVVGGTLGAAALIILLIALKKRKKKDKK